MKGAEFRTVPENLSDWGMHCCVLHCLNFPVNGFSVRRRSRKTGHQRKGSVPEPYGVCCWCVLQMGFWRTWCHVGEGRMREIRGSRLQQQTDETEPSYEAWNNSMVKFPGSLWILQWGGVWESSNWRMNRHSQLGTSKKACAAMAMPQNIICSPRVSPVVFLSLVSAVHWWLTSWSWLNTEPVWMTGMFLPLKCGEAV